MKSKCTKIQNGSFEEYLFFSEYGDEYCQNTLLSGLYSLGTLNNLSHK